MTLGLGARQHTCATTIFYYCLRSIIGVLCEIPVENGDVSGVRAILYTRDKIHHRFTLDNPCAQRERFPFEALVGRFHVRSPVVASFKSLPGKGNAPRLTHALIKCDAHSLRGHNT